MFTAFLKSLQSLHTFCYIDIPCDADTTRYIFPPSQTKYLSSASLGRAVGFALLLARLLPVCVSLRPKPAATCIHQMRGSDVWARQPCDGRTELDRATGLEREWRQHPELAIPQLSHNCWHEMTLLLLLALWHRCGTVQWGQIAIGPGLSKKRMLSFDIK